MEQYLQNEKLENHIKSIKQTNKQADHSNNEIVSIAAGTSCRRHETKQNDPIHFTLLYYTIPYYMILYIHATKILFTFYMIKF